MKNIIIIILLAIIAYLTGTTMSLWDSNNLLRDENAVKTEIMGAYDDALHYFYSNSEDWMDFRETKEYNALDSLKQGDWEDFFYY